MKARKTLNQEELAVIDDQIKEKREILITLLPAREKSAEIREIDVQSLHEAQSCIRIGEFRIQSSKRRSNPFAVNAEYLFSC